MEITIIGTGNMARGIGTRAVAGGHDVTLLGTEQAHAEELAAELGGDSVKAGTVGDPIAGDVVVLAVWYPVSLEVVERYGDQLDGKVVVDITNPVDTETWDRLATTPGSSSAEEVAELVPDGTSVVKAFNISFAPALVAGEVGGQPLDILIAGDDADAKQKVSRLVADGGLRPLDVGPLARAQQLEHLGFLHISVQQPLGLGFASAIKLLS